jgi:hypothetical protein
MTPATPKLLRPRPEALLPELLLPVELVEDGEVEVFELVPVPGIPEVEVPELAGVVAGVVAVLVPPPLTLLELPMQEVSLLVWTVTISE